MGAGFDHLFSPSKETEPTGREKTMIRRNQLPLWSKTILLEVRKRKVKAKLNKYLFGNVLPTTAAAMILHTVCIVYASTVRFSEGQLPHNTIIPDHDERQASPKMSTVAPPYIPW